MDSQWFSALTHLNLVDYGIITIVFLSVIISVIRGFVREALSLLAWIAAIAAVIMLTSRGADLLSGLVESQSARLMISFTVIFLGVLLLGSLLSYLIGLAIKKTGLSGVDRIIGLGFGLLRGLLIVTVIIIGIGFTPLAEQTLWKSSALVPEFKSMTQWGMERLPAAINRYDK